LPEVPGIGVPLVRSLVAMGHQVTALTRSAAKQADLRSLGAAPAVADALDRDALGAVVAAARPTHVIHQLTALPNEGPRRESDLVATNRLRTEGTRNLLEASIAAGAQRIVVGSFAPLAAAAAGQPSPAREAVDATASMESQVLKASRDGRIEGVILRYGLFYGPENPSTLKMMDLVRHRRLPVIRGDRGLLPFIHVDDAVSATVAALDRAPAGGVYDIVDDRALSLSELVCAISHQLGVAEPFTMPAWLFRLVEPYRSKMLSMRLPLSNEKAKAELGWHLDYPTWREGLAQMIKRAA
jgi:2-alkyl-3-oxoalkanoate reductase